MYSVSNQQTRGFDVAIQEGSFQTVPQFWIEANLVRDAFKRLTKTFSKDPIGVTVSSVGLLMSAVLPIAGAIIGYSSITHRPDEIKVKACENGLNNSLFGSLVSGTGSYVFRVVSWSAPFIPFAMVLVSSAVTGFRNYREEMEEGLLGDDGQKLQFSLTERVGILKDHIQGAVVETMPWKRLAHTVFIVGLAFFASPLAVLSPLAAVLGEGLAIEVVTQTTLGVARAVAGSIHAIQNSKVACYTATGLQGLISLTNSVLLTHSAHYCYRAADTSNAMLWTGAIVIGSTVVAAATAVIAKIGQHVSNKEFREWHESRKAQAKPFSQVFFHAPVTSACCR